MWNLTACKVSAIVSCSWSEMIFLFYLWVNQRLIKNHFIFWSSSKMRDQMKFYRLSDATFYYSINTIYQFIKPFLDKKCLFLRDMALIWCHSMPYIMYHAFNVVNKISMVKNNKDVQEKPQSQKIACQWHHEETRMDSTHITNQQQAKQPVSTSLMM